MKGRRNTCVASEGMPYVSALLMLSGLALRYDFLLVALVLLVLLVLLGLIFRDPLRAVPAVPLGVVSPVDGFVTDVGLTDKSVLDSEAHKIILNVDSFGTYTARCPVEGKIMEIGDVSQPGRRGHGTMGLWVQTDEGEDVVLHFHGHRFGLAPLAFDRFGERVGQGQRCAYLRLTRYAEVQLPINARVLVSRGERVIAGQTLLAKLHPH